MEGIGKIMNKVAEIEGKIYRKKCTKKGRERKNETD